MSKFIFFSKKSFLFFLESCAFFLYPSFQSIAQEATVKSPDGRVVVEIFLEDGIPTYGVTYGDAIFLEHSALGLVTNRADYSKNLTLESQKTFQIDTSYTQDKIKKSSIDYVANGLVCAFKNPDGQLLLIRFQVDNNNVGYRYEIPAFGETLSMVVEKENSAFNFPAETKSYLTPQSDAMVGFRRSKPSYEEGYKIDQNITQASQFNHGFTFSGLFKIGDKGWVLLSETGVRGLYCGSHLSDPTPEGTYSIAYPDPAENNGFGSTGAAIALPAETPWRTITLGNSLKPIVETTIPYDLVQPLYKPSVDYEYGKGTWSWIMWQDNSMNYDDQVTYIDFASQLGFKYILIDAWWDTNIGYDRMEKLIDYAHSKNVDVFLWYNSNGVANDAHQTPRNKMNTAIARKKEMQWMKEHGVKGIKVDFFGGDKQETMRLYENILSDANDYGLICVFHGTTLPRGWERMFPNYAGSEAVLASENLMFSQHANDLEAFSAALHPFMRNAVGSMEFGGVVLNERYNRTNDGGNTRRTTDAFQLAISVLFQNPVQFMALAPNNLEDAPAFEIDFLKQVPTTWDDTQFIDGFPGKYVVLARKNGNSWYISGINATKKAMSLELNLPMLAGKTVKLYADDKNNKTYTKEIIIKSNGTFSISMQPEGGMVLTDQ